MSEISLKKEQVRIGNQRESVRVEVEDGFYEQLNPTNITYNEPGITYNEPGYFYNNSLEGTKPRIGKL
jgi:hypothetical protein